MPQTPAIARWPAVSLTPSDRLLILAPHPDDEVLCCGGLLQQAHELHLPVRVVFFTYGDNIQWSFLLYRKHPVLLPVAVQRMGLVRHDEAVAADRLLGVEPDALVFLGYPDFGTLHLWTDHWGDRPPFQSMLTHVTAVPYANALRPGAPYTGEEVLRDLTTVLREFRPTKVFVSHPGDHMPDHRALYLFARVALWDLEPDLRPELYPYLVHFRRWPSPRGYRPAEPLAPPVPFAGPVVWRASRFGGRAVARKHRAIQAHRTQYEASASYLLSFIRPNELFGDFPILPLKRLGTAALAPGAGPPPSELPEQLTDEERAVFVGVEDRSVALDGATLVLSLAFSRPLAEAVEASVEVFGYRRDRPFGAMPKIHVQVGALRTLVFDQRRQLPRNAVEVRRQLNALTIRVPLAVLGDPQKILTSARTSLGELPLDWVSWRILDLTGDSSDEAAGPSAGLTSDPPVLH